MKTIKKLSIVTFSIAITSFIGCNDEAPVANTPKANLEEMFKAKSNLDALVKIDSKFSNKVSTYSLISSTDSIPFNGDENKKFRLAGTVDGAGLIRDGENFIYTVNCEDAFSVARIKLDKNLTPISGDYLLNSGVDAVARQCSATMWEKEIHGGSKDLFLSASENYSFLVKGIDPRVTKPTPDADFQIAAFGAFGWENIVPLPKDAYPGKTVLFGGSDYKDGQLVMYYSENGDADLENGKVYVLKAKEISDGNKGKTLVNADERYDENSFDLQTEYEVEFVEVENAKELDVDQTLTKCQEIKATQFFRVEDVDYQKGSAENNRNVYFNVTGTFNADQNLWGTVYKLALDKNDPKKGKLTQIVRGHERNGEAPNITELQSPDNICVTENYVYIQEDPNSFDKKHNAYIYQTDLNGNNASKVLEIIVNKELLPEDKKDTEFSGEFGSLIDVSEKVGVEGTFILALQPHYWKNDNLKGFDGHNHDQFELNQGSQIVILKGLPK